MEPVSARLGLGGLVALGLLLLGFAFAGMASLDTRLAVADRPQVRPLTTQEVRLDQRRCSPQRQLDRHL